MFLYPTRVNIKCVCDLFESMGMSSEWDAKKSTPRRAQFAQIQKRTTRALVCKWMESRWRVGRVSVCAGGRWRRSGENGCERLLRISSSHRRRVGRSLYRCRFICCAHLYAYATMMWFVLVCVVLVWLGVRHTQMTSHTNNCYHLDTPHTHTLHNIPRHVHITHTHLRRWLPTKWIHNLRFMLA